MSNLTHSKSKWIKIKHYLPLPSSHSPPRSVNLIKYLHLNRLTFKVSKNADLFKVNKINEQLQTFSQELCLKLQCMSHPMLMN